MPGHAALANPLAVILSGPRAEQSGAIVRGILMMAMVLAMMAAQATAVSAETAPTVIFGTPGILEKKPPARAPEVKAPTTVWPRLDPGAALCRTEADLSRLAERRRGESNGAVDCQAVRVPTGVTVLRRQPGRTQVQVSGGQTIGWTDVWLPEKAPAR